MMGKIATIAKMTANEKYASRFGLATSLGAFTILPIIQDVCGIIGKVYYITSYLIRKIASLFILACRVYFAEHNSPQTQTQAGNH